MARETRAREGGLQLGLGGVEADPGAAGGFGQAVAGDEQGDEATLGRTQVIDRGDAGALRRDRAVRVAEQ